MPEFFCLITKNLVRLGQSNKLWLLRLTSASRAIATFVKIYYLITLQMAVSPIMSPHSSPRNIRRCITPIATGPPPLPPRRNSPTLDHLNTTVAQSIAASTSLLCHSSEEMRELRNPMGTPLLGRSSSLQNVSRDTSSSDTVELSSPETIFGIVISDYCQEGKFFAYCVSQAIFGL